MWSKLIDWLFMIIQNIADFGEWLFTPISIGGAFEGMQDLNEGLMKSGLSNVTPNWLYGWLTTQVNNNEFFLMPISLLSISFLIGILAWKVVKFIA